MRVFAWIKIGLEFATFKLFDLHLGYWIPYEMEWLLVYDGT